MSKDDDHPVDRTQGIVQIMPSYQIKSILKIQHNHSVSLPECMFILQILIFVNSTFQDCLLSEIVKEKLNMKLQFKIVK